MRASTPLATLAVICLLGTGCYHHHHHHDYDGDDDYTVIRIDDLPPDVRDHFYHDHPGCDVHEVRVEHAGGEDHYHFKYNDHGQDHETEYHHGGEEIHSDYH